MPTAHAVLNRLAWERGRGRLVDVRITVRHRGAPGDELVLTSEEVRALHRHWIETAEGTLIPYHRVLRIEAAGREVWRRAPPSSSERAWPPP